MTELTWYLPFHNRLENVKGFRIRQDFRAYNAKESFFVGGSVMAMRQSLGYTAVIPINDSDYYTKPYTLRKTIFSPSFLTGSNTKFGLGSKWYLETCMYVGFRFKDAYTDGLTPTETSSMWNYDLSPEDWQMRIILKQGMHVGAEFTVSLEIGYTI